MAKTYLRLLILLSFASSLWAQSPLLSREKFAGLSIEQQNAVVIKSMELITELESRYQHEVLTTGYDQGRFERFTTVVKKLNSLFIDSAFAAGKSWQDYGAEYSSMISKANGNQCVYGGWVSQIKGKYCTHPMNLPAAASERKAYSSTGCPGIANIACNPVVFGFKEATKSSLLCVPAGVPNDNAHNSSLACMKKSLSTEGDGKESRLKFLRENLKKPENARIVEDVYKFLNKSCICPTTSVLNKKYHDYMLPHRTCYGLMNMLSATVVCEEAGVSSIMDTGFFRDLQSVAVPEGAVGGGYDDFYKDFLRKIKVSKFSEIKNLCGTDPFDPDAGTSTLKSGTTTSGSTGGSSTGGNSSGDQPASEDGPDIVVTGTKLKPESITGNLDGKTTGTGPTQIPNLGGSTPGLIVSDKPTSTPTTPTLTTSGTTGSGTTGGTTTPGKTGPTPASTTPPPPKDDDESQEIVVQGKVPPCTATCVPKAGPEKFSCSIKDTAGDLAEIASVVAPPDGKQTELKIKIKSSGKERSCAVEYPGKDEGETPCTVVCKPTPKKVASLVSAAPDGDAEAEVAPAKFTCDFKDKDDKPILNPIFTQPADEKAESVKLTLAGKQVDCKVKSPEKKDDGKGDPKIAVKIELNGPGGVSVQASIDGKKDDIPLPYDIVWYRKGADGLVGLIKHTTDVVGDPEKDPKKKKKSALTVNDGSSDSSEEEPSKDKPGSPPGKGPGTKPAAEEKEEGKEKPLELKDGEFSHNVMKVDENKASKPYQLCAKLKKSGEDAGEACVTVPALTSVFNNGQKPAQMMSPTLNGFRNGIR